MRRGQEDAGIGQTGDDYTAVGMLIPLFDLEYFAVRKCSEEERNG
jgi:hypothetical protein